MVNNTKNNILKQTITIIKKNNNNMALVHAESTILYK